MWALDALPSRLDRPGSVRLVEGRAFLFLAGVPEVFGVDLSVARGGADALERAFADAAVLVERGWFVEETPREAPRALGLVLTTACNLACDYCNVSGGSYGRLRRTMSAETIESALDWLRSLDDEGAGPTTRKKVVFFGGEPLLAFPALVDAATRARRRFPDVELAVVTNGTLVDDEIAAFFAEHGVEVTLSIDGDADSHDRHRRDHAGRGSHARATAGVETLVRHGVTPLLRATYAGGGSSFDERVAALERVGRRRLPIVVERLDVPAAGDDYDDASAALFARDVREGRAPDTLVPFVDAVVRGAHGASLACTAGRDVVVLPDGDVFPCQISADAGHERIASLLDREDDRRARHAETRARFGALPTRCRSCFASGLCGHGCPMRTARGEEPSDADCRWSIDRLDHAAYLADTLSFERLAELLLARTPPADRTALRAGLMLREFARERARALWPISFPTHVPGAG